MYRQVGDLNPYALDYPVCTEDSRRNRRLGRSQRTWLLNFLLGAAREGANAGNPLLPLSEEGEEKLRKIVGLQPVDGYEPCEEDYMTNYLNQASVQSALNVQSFSGNWVDCSRTLRHGNPASSSSSLPLPLSSSS